MPAQLGRSPVEEVILTLDQYNGRIVVTAIRDGFESIEGAETSGVFWSRLMSFAADCVPAACGSGGAWAARPEEERRKAVLAVAQHGAEIFQEMIPDPSNRERLRRILGVGSDVEPPRIRAVSRAALVPWEALCLVDEGVTPASEDFLGWRCVIVRDTGSALSARRAKMRRVETVNAVEDNALPSVDFGHARVARERYPAAAYSTLPRLSAVPADYQTFHDYLFPAEGRLDLIHFDCHVELHRLPDRSHVRVTENFSLPFEEFESGRLDLAHLPVVVFNGCHGGTLGLGQVASLASRFRNAGAASIVAGEYEIGDDFCVEFAETFYSVAAKSTDVGAALLETRRRFLGFDLNPLGLFYGLYGGADLELDVSDCLAPANGSLLERRMGWPDQDAA